MTVFIDSATLTDLKIACGIKYKPDRQDMTLDYVPCQCTSILLKSSDYTGKLPYKILYFVGH